MLAAGIDDEHEKVAAMTDHEVVDNSAVRVGEERVALPARRKPHDVDRDEPLERPCRAPELPKRRRSVICPMCETSNRDAAARVCRCSLRMPGL